MGKIENIHINPPSPFLLHFLTPKQVEGFPSPPNSETKSNRTCSIITKIVCIWHTYMIKDEIVNHPIRNIYDEPSLVY